MANNQQQHEIRKTAELPGGASITVTVASPAPIDPRDYLIFRPGAAVEMGKFLVGLANAFRPPNSEEIIL
jgi:hypothetical protein